jgi:hypothetical protein
MHWLVIGAIVIVVCILAFIGGLFLATNLRQEVDESARLLPPQDLGHALDILDEGE